ncbi:LysR substrate-binding domain-containing protein [Oceanicoccus sagamiensis]|uniref:HTH lysR-type domain-containing protein n=1 Tax=Oceanicoccus sagamiensis TaxID=716816 RepID=A0A1X9N9H4_9GAMM|nr:LysR substrate-binding domain-containing protein [Oceanicoccus sagamiensis]ARN74710.1 hypothetical protein BST96_11605 [Oceanicoccus sagamiensis]
MPSPLSLEALEVLDAIERKGSFAAAATHLNRVPSAVSYTVQKLEQDLDISLFQRQGRKSVLTGAGKHLVEQGRQLLLAASDIAASTQQVATGWEPRLRIALDHILPDEYLLPIIEQLYQVQPAINLELSQEVLAGTWEALVEDRVDLIIGAVDAAPNHKGIRSIPWHDTQAVFVASPKHPICQQSQPLTEQQIRQSRSVIVRDSSKNLAPLSRGIHNKKSSIYVPNMAMKIAAHRQGLGVGSLPRHLVKDELANGTLVELKVSHNRPITKNHIAWKISNRGQALKWLVDKLQQQPPL